MGQVWSKLARPVSQSEQDKWLASIIPVKGEFRAFMVGIAAGCIYHEHPFGLQWEREVIMERLQKIKNPLVAKLMWFLGQICSGEFMVPYLAFLYWFLDRHKGVYMVWLIPLSELLNGIMKWYFRVPRPGWVDPRIQMLAWSHEYSFPSSHAQMIWALASFASGTSVGYLRGKLYGSFGRTALAYWYFLGAPYAFAALVCVSRVYEGVHYPRDVIVGSGVGVGVASVYMHFLPAIKEFLLNHSPVVRVLILEFFSLIAMGLLLLAHKAHAEPPPDLQQWLATAAVGRNRGKTIDVIGPPLASYLGMTGCLMGASACIPLIYLIPIKRSPTFLRAILRFIIGNAGLMGVFFGIRQVEKKVFDESSVSGRIARIVRYASVPFSMYLIMPFFF